MPIAPPKKQEGNPNAWSSDYWVSKIGQAEYGVYNDNCLNALGNDPIFRNRNYDFIFSDPPYNIGQEYKGFEDRIPPGEHSVFTLQWIAACIDHLYPTGILCLHGTDAMVELYLRIMAMHPEFKRVAWINWHYRFGQCTFNNWIDSRCHCLVYSRGNYIWNPQDVLVDSDRLTKYKDKRCANSKYKGKRVPFTLWGIPSDGEGWGRVSGKKSNKERREAHPNQLPELYLARLMRAYTNVGSRILDPFGGSGTSIIVAKALGRSCDTIEISADSCRSIVERLKRGAVRV